MALLAVLVVFALEFYFRWGSQYRNFDWYEQYIRMLTEQFESNEVFKHWTGVILLVAGPALVLAVILSLFGGLFFSLVFLILSIGVLFYCLGPTSMESSLSSYFEAMERGDKVAASFILKEGVENDQVPVGDEIVRNATRYILVESNRRYFGAVTWFIILGPVGALFYRLSHQYHEHCITQELDEHLTLVNQLIHWIDWIPSRLTSFFNLLTGDFVNGFYRLKDYITDVETNNEQILSETGIAALGLQMGVSDGDIQENKDAKAMVFRTGMFYVVIAAVLSPITFW